MDDNMKKRQKDYKHIITTRSFDTGFYHAGLPYLIKFNGDEKGNSFLRGSGVGICIEASGGNLTFVFVKGTHIHEKYETEVVSFSCKYLDNSNIEIIPYWDDISVLKLIDSVICDPEKYDGYSYWNWVGDYDGDVLLDKTESEEENSGVSLRDWNDIILGTPREEIADDVETEPNPKKFYIDDWNKIIDPNVSTKYPLFVRDEHSGDRWIINYDVLSKALYRKDVIFDISFKMKNPLRAQGFCSCNSMDVQVHVGGSVLTGKRPSKKDACIHDAAIEFRAGDWKEMAFAHVILRRK